MESVGVKSYVVSVPGHAFPMISLPDSETWLPIESTMVESGDSTPIDAMLSAGETLEEAYNEEKMTVIDIEHWWNAGIMPIW